MSERTPWRLPGGGIGLGGLFSEEGPGDAGEDSLASRQPSQQAIERGRARRMNDAWRDAQALARTLRDPWD